MKAETIYYKVAKQSKSAQQNTPAEIFIVEQGELEHFLHEQLSADCILIFDEMPLRNLYTLINDAD